MENEATVSKNFIEQIIEKDLAEGHCKTCLLYTSPLPTIWFGKQANGCAQMMFVTPSLMSSSISPVKNQPSPV